MLADALLTDPGTPGHVVDALVWSAVDPDASACTIAAALTHPSRTVPVHAPCRQDATATRWALTRPYLTPPGRRDVIAHAAIRDLVSYTVSVPDPHPDVIRALDHAATRDGPRHLRLNCALACHPGLDSAVRRAATVRELAQERPTRLLTAMIAHHPDLLPTAQARTYPGADLTTELDAMAGAVSAGQPAMDWYVGHVLGTYDEHNRGRTMPVLHHPDLAAHAIATAASATTHGELNVVIADPHLPHATRVRALTVLLTHGGYLDHARTDTTTLLTPDALLTLIPAASDLDQLTDLLRDTDPATLTAPVITALTDAAGQDQAAERDELLTVLATHPSSTPAARARARAALLTATPLVGPPHLETLQVALRAATTHLVTADGHLVPDGLGHLTCQHLRSLTRDADTFRTLPALAPHVRQVFWARIRPTAPAAGAAAQVAMALAPTFDGTLGELVDVAVTTTT